MARPVYSRQLISAVVTTGVPAQFIIADFETLVVRDVWLGINADSSAADVLTLDHDGIEFLAVAFAAGVVDGFHQELRSVAPGPTVLNAQLTLGSAANVIVSISGYVLTP